MAQDWDPGSGGIYLSMRHASACAYTDTHSVLSLEDFPVQEFGGNWTGQSDPIPDLEDKVEYNVRGV